MAGQEFHPLTPERWSDFESLMGPNGACMGCWCMSWRLSRREFDASKGDGNRQAIKRIVERGPAPGVLAYEEERAVGWCAVAPREEYEALGRSRLFRNLGGEGVWSISCLFVARGNRKKGLSSALANAAAEYAFAQGARIVEAYPHTLKRQTADVFVWTGLTGTFERAGFVETARPSQSRSVMRRTGVR